MARDRPSRPEAKAVRLFVAVDVPDEVKTAVAEATRPWRDVVPGARWTRPEGWHVTLKFLGWTWPRLVEDVGRAVGAAAGGSGPFETSVTDVGALPSPRRARVLWVGLEDPGERFAQMVKQLDHLLATHFKVETRAFTPHLTLARVNPPQDVRAVAAGPLGSPVSSPPFVVDRLVLYRSHLSPKGATYEPLAEAPLEG